jgi:CRISPR-associated protein Csh1
MVMLKTLVKLGEELSQNRTQWDDIIDIPNLQQAGKRGNKITYYAINLIFDIDEQTIRFGDIAELSLTNKQKDFSPHGLKYVKVLGGNNKAIYTTVEEKKLDQLPKTLFGKPVNGKFPEKGEFMQALEKAGKEMTELPLYKALQLIKPLQDKFYQKFSNSEDGKIDNKAFKEQLSLGKNEKIGLVFTSIKSQELGFCEPISINQLEGFDEFIESQFFQSNTRQGIDYLTGENSNEIVSAEFTDRDNFTALFVGETKNYSSFTMNYATQTGKIAFPANYQISEKTKKYIERSSRHFSKKVNLKIAGVNHTIIPEFLKDPEIAYKEAIVQIHKQSELLFSLPKLSEAVKNAEEEIDDSKGIPVFCLNFLAYESDGNFFKIINHIKDVSQFHLVQTIETFVKTHQLLKPWLGDILFNLQQAYGIIPVRQDKEKKNNALILFKDILEQRPIAIETLYEHYSELILCHWYERYYSYTNVYSKFQTFDFAAKDATFKYLALIQVLKSLQSLTKNDDIMDNETQTKHEIAEKLDQQTNEFLEKMNFNDQQKALFFLGKALNSIAFAQYAKNHSSKPILSKVNYNGMERDDIMRLNIDLMEKAKQYHQIEYNGKYYNILNQVEGNLGQFSKHFDYHNWALKPTEALFFILNGYTYSIQQAKENTTEQ